MEAIPAAPRKLPRLRSLGARLEGVETEHELSQLRRFGCDVAQGFHVGRPMSAEALETWLAAATGRALGSRTGALSSE